MGARTLVSCRRCGVQGEEDDTDPCPGLYPRFGCRVALALARGDAALMPTLDCPCAVTEPLVWCDLPYGVLGLRWGTYLTLLAYGCLLPTGALADALRAVRGRRRQKGN